MVIEPDDLDPLTLQVAVAAGLMPHLQKYLITTGVVFQNYYVTDARGCPTREGYFNGRYFHNLVPETSNHQCGFFQFRDKETIAVWLHNAGYRTMFIGKYLDGYGYEDANGDGAVNQADATYIPPGWDRWIAMPFYQPVVNGMVPPPGTILPQDNPNEYEYYLTSNGQLTYHGESPSDYQTDVLTATTGKALDSPPGDSRPLFLFLAPGAPHFETNYFPHDMPGGYPNVFAWDVRPSPSYSGTVSFPLPEPPNFNASDLVGKPEWITSKEPLTATDISNLTDQWNHRLAALRSVDDLIGTVVKGLGDRGMMGNTVFLFFSDNGWMYGNWRLGAKLAAYDPSASTPLIVSVGPAVQTTVAGESTKALIVSTDIVPTILDFAGVSVDAPLDGTSFRAVLSDPKGLWRNRVLIEHWRALRGDTAVFDLPDYKAIRTAPGAEVLPNQLFVYYNTTSEVEYYNLSSDPWAMTNLAMNPAPPVRLAVQKMLTDLNALASCAGRGCRSAEWKP